MNTRALLVALLLAGLGAFLLVVYLQRYEEERSGGAKVPVVVVTKAIKRGEVLTEDMLATRPVPMAYVEDRAVKAIEKSKVLGLPVSNPLDANQTLMWTDMAFASDKRRDLSSLIQRGSRAVTLRATSGDKSFMLIRPGDYVDVLANLEHEEAGKKQTKSVVLMQRVLVLAVGADTSMPGLDEEEGAKYQPREMLLTLSVSLRQAQLTSVAQSKGTIGVVLRNPDDPIVSEDIPELDSSVLSKAENRQSFVRARPKGPVEVTEQ